MRFGQEAIVWAACGVAAGIAVATCATGCGVPPARPASLSAPDGGPPGARRAGGAARAPERGVPS